jgi:hypothetical protein
MADYYTLLTNAGIAYETACKAAGLPIKLSQISVGDGAGTVYNPAATDTSLKREVWRGPLNALFQDEKNPSWLLAEVTIPPDVGGWYVREAGIWTDTGILYAIVKYPESFKPILATSGSGKEFYIRSIFETSNAALVTLLIDDTVVKATRAWVSSYVADELAKLDNKQSVRVATTANVALAGAQTIDGVAVVAGDRVLVKNQSLAKDNGIWVAAVGAWSRAKDADTSVEVTSALTVSVEQGSTLADTIWQLVTDGTIVLGTTSLTFQNVTQGFAPLNSPVLINPTANTPPLLDDTKAIATTEFVRRAGGNYRTYTGFSAAGTVGLDSVGAVVMLTGSSAFTVTLLSAKLLRPGDVISFRNIGIGNVTVACAMGGDFITSGSGGIASIDLQPGTSLELVSDGKGIWFASGSAQLQYSQVQAKTPAQFDNSKLLATTEFAQRAQGSFSGYTPVVASRTLTAADIGKLLWLSSAGTYTLTIPAPSALGLPDGASFSVFATSALGVVAAGGSATIQMQGGSIVASINIKVGQSAKFVVIGMNQWMLTDSTAGLDKNADFASSFGSIGYQKLPSGDVEQWGLYVSAPSGANTVIPLPVALSAAPYNIQLSFADFSSDQPVGSFPVFQARNSTPGTITVRNMYGANASFFWRVRGKA